jgi:hypothetical protein
MLNLNYHLYNDVDAINVLYGVSGNCFHIVLPLDESKEKHNNPEEMINPCIHRL